MFQFKISQNFKEAYFREKLSYSKTVFFILKSKVCALRSIRYILILTTPLSSFQK